MYLFVDDVRNIPEGCLFLSDDADTIRRKISKANYVIDGGESLTKLASKFGLTFDVHKANESKSQLADAIISLLI